MDQLFQFHYVPKLATDIDNITIKTHTSAIHLEEKLPTTLHGTIDRKTLAPEQIYEKPNSKLLTGKSELNTQEKQTLRRTNKRKAINQKQQKELEIRARSNVDSKFKDWMSKVLFFISFFFWIVCFFLFQFFVFYAVDFQTQKPKNKK